ncbi:ABC transporter ATP-binding protein [Mumia zhuanghuii]|uniref:ATP-binding cassette domain-containing protein n=1 Tax=Mumia zhuanghuii TaxID=2585211 RepID=A0A5C4LXC9_9ACTN|nr:ATP-binding cassette domain-containing protein [Mumia zhuanghuii]TNC23463.1 ATP-binding cassette domain-containing protein [Mumia zhuanghuii]TNC23484.1 ATP-binding cassette domain-containing protein [Mumia zhuanghuii]
MTLTVSELAYAYGRFRPKRVFDSLHWTVPPGQRTLLLGPNGSGKSTLLKLMCGYLRPNRGTVAYDGESSRRRIHRHVAWMPQTITPIRGLSVVDQLEYASWAAGSPRKQCGELARDAIAAVRLEDQARARTTALSGGQLRRLGLAQALVRQGDVLLLDEPTAGLDPAQTLNFRQLLETIAPPGGLVVSTHQVTDLVGEFDRVAVLAEGTIRFDGTVDEFAQQGERSGMGSGGMEDIFTMIVQGGLH